MAEKTLAQTYSVESPVIVDADDVFRLNGNSNDAKDMQRLGKRQELKRSFSLVSIIGFVTILQSSWEGTLVANSFGLYNGGTAGVIWCTIAVWICMLATIASMAEMASMAPTAGGQYHWVSEFSPQSFQKPLSYVVGYCSCLAWISGIPGAGSMLCALIQGLILLKNPDADFTALWQITLLTFLFLFLAFSFNIFMDKYLAIAETIVMVLHFVAFVVFMGIFWGMSDIAPAKDVFTNAVDGGGWGNIGLSTLVGIATPLWCFIGPDAGAHMSEELTDASLALPRAMMWATFGNGLLGVAMLITFCFCAGDITTILNSPTGSPMVQVLYNSTQSYGATVVLTSTIIILGFFGTITLIAASSRQSWAFARDRGFPYSEKLLQVREVCGQPIPLNSLLFCLAISLILEAINFGSDVALNAIVSVSNAALVFSYIISLGCLRIKRLRGERLLPRRWDLGRWGAPLNDLALIFLIVSFIFSFFPETPMVGDPTWAADFNWAIVMFAATCLLALSYYWMGGRNKYVPPVRLVKQE